MIGAVTIIGLYMTLLFRGVRAALKTGNKFYRFLAAGITIYLVFQAILIIGGNIRMLPITGVTLPLVSYGGSSLITSMLAIFIIVLISDCPLENFQDFKGLIPFRNGTIILATGLISLALVTGWWAMIRSNDMQLRTDNARNLIASRYVKRGAILDRNGKSLAETYGTTGSYEHKIIYTPLSNTIGYYNYNYGTTGLEDVYDDYLSGIQGYPAFNLWFNYLLYDQPLPGRDVKLTLDLKIQEKLDSLLPDYQGSAVVLDASSGEILAMASHPYYDANELDNNWDQWKNDPRSPLLNRAMQGAYPLGELLTPFLISEDESILESDLASSTTGTCALNPENPALWSQSISYGCPGALDVATADKTGDYLINTINKYGLNTAIDIGLPGNSSQVLDESLSIQQLLSGKEPVRISPMQIAYAYSIFSNSGKQAIPRILAAVNTQKEGWVISNPSENVQVIPVETAEAINRLLASEKIAGWEISTQSKDVNGTYFWYVTGTPSNWSGTPMVLAIVAENGSTQDLREIGQQIFSTISEF